MKNEKREILGFKVTIVGIVENLQEAVSAAGSEEAVVSDYNANVLAHSHYTILRRNICETLEKLTGIPRLRDGEGDKAKIVEKEAAYIARLEDQLGEDGLAQYESQIDELSKSIPVDYKPGTRGSGSSAIPATKWLAYYDQLVEEDMLNAFIEKYSIETDGRSDEEIKYAVANKAREIVTARLREEEKKALASL